MGKVKLEVMPWITTQCGYNSPGNLIIEEEIEGGETIAQVIGKISVKRRPLGECILDRATQAVHGYISIVLNDRLIPNTNTRNTRVRDGDVIKLFPTIDGG